MITLHGFCYNSSTQKEFDFTLSIATVKPSLTVTIDTGGEFLSPISGRKCGNFGIVGEQEDMFNPNFYVLPDVTAEFVSGDYSEFESLKASLESFQSLMTADAYFPPDGKYGIYWMSQYGFSGTATTGFYDADYDFPSVGAYKAAYDNGEISPHTDNVMRYDIYIDGTKDPSITAIPTYASGSDLSTLTLEPKLWYSVNHASIIPVDSPIIEVDGVNVPNSSHWTVSDQVVLQLLENYTNQYLSYTNDLTRGLSSVSKVTHFGIDGIPDDLSLYLRFDYNTGLEIQYSKLIEVIIPREVDDISDVRIYTIPDSEKGDPDYKLEVAIHLNAPPSYLDDDDEDYSGGKDEDGDDGGVYDDPEDVDDYTQYDGVGFNGDAVLTKTYALNKTTLENIGTKLWSQSYFDVLKVQSNPIENIVCLKHFPFKSAGTTESITIGDVDFQINGDVVPSCKSFDVGTYKYEGYHHSFLDFSPWTIIKCYLPYIGWVQFDASSIYKSTLKFKYVVDLVSGECMCKIVRDTKEIPFMEYRGNMGIDLPLTASNAMQEQIKLASAGINVAAAVTGHVMSGDAFGAVTTAASGALNMAGEDYSTQRTGAPAPLCSSFANHAIVVIVEHPLTEGATPSNGYKHLHGKPCHKYMKLGSFTGFVQVDRRADIKIAMTSEENALLEQLLTTGVYV